MEFQAALYLGPEPLSGMLQGGLDKIRRNPIEVFPQALISRVNTKETSRSEVFDLGLVNIIP